MWSQRRRSTSLPTRKVTVSETRTKHELLLSNCAYWAMSALGVEGSPRHIQEIREIYLRNILNASREFIVNVEGADSTVKYGGASATFIPPNGWPAPEIEWMNARE